MIQQIQPFPNQYKTQGNFRQILDKSSYFEPGYGSIDLELGIIQEPGIYGFQCKFGVSWQKKFDFGEFKKKGDFKFLTKMGRLTRNLDSMFSIVFKNSSSGIFEILIFGQNMSKQWSKTIFTNFQVISIIFVGQVSVSVLQLSLIFYIYIGVHFWS